MSKNCFALLSWVLLGLGVAAPAGARDPGVNQPGAVGNRDPGAPGAGTVDPGINQPGAAGNRGTAGGAPGVGKVDPGVNQPGAAGNRGLGGDPGINQPGVAGNTRAVARRSVR